MDCIEGMKELKDKSFDLCLTDFPFNVKYKGQGNKIKNDSKVIYEDNMSPEQYEKWCMDVFHEIQRVSIGQIIFCGNTNLKMWYRNTDPIDMGFHLKINCESRGTAFKLVKHDTFLVYGELNHPIHLSVLRHSLNNVFLNENQYIHPCPNVVGLYKDLILQTRSKSVIDPMLGSGTTSEVCEWYAQKWVGFEIMEEYSVDIEKRIARGIRKHSQTNLNKYIGVHEKE